MLYQFVVLLVLFIPAIWLCSMLSATVLCNDLKANLRNLTDAKMALKIMGDTIAQHIQNNAELKFSWKAVGMVPAGPAMVSKADTTSQCEGKILNCQIVLTPSMADTYQAAMLHLNTEIMNGVMAATYNVTTTMFNTSPGTMVGIPLCNITPSMNSDRDAAMLKLSTDIVTWIKAFVPMAPCIGMHIEPPAVPAYFGTALATVIM